MEAREGFLHAHGYGSFFDSSPSQLPDDRMVWSFEENKIFEDSLAVLDPSYPNFFENLASRIPFKTIEHVKSHYRTLIDDIEMIEAGLVDPTEYKDSTRGGLKVAENGHGSLSNKRRENASHISKKGVPWSEEEHRLFLKGLEKYGKGDWKSISRYYVLTRTPIQVASHAQKYYRRLQATGPFKRRRYSIHDINITTTTTTTTTTDTDSAPPKPECKNREQVEKPVSPPNANSHNNMISFSNNQQEPSPYISHHISTFSSPMTTSTNSASSMSQMASMTQFSDAFSSSSSFVSPADYWLKRT